MRKRDHKSTFRSKTEVQERWKKDSLRNSHHWSCLFPNFLLLNTHLLFSLSLKKKGISESENVPTLKIDWLSKSQKPGILTPDPIPRPSSLYRERQPASLLGRPGQTSSIPGGLLVLGTDVTESQSNSFRAVKLKVDFTQQISLLLLSNEIIHGYSPRMLTLWAQVLCPFCSLFTTVLYRSHRYSLILAKQITRSTSFQFLQQPSTHLPPAWSHIPTRFISS